jgi:hypothetical protein
VPDDVRRGLAQSSTRNPFREARLERVGCLRTLLRQQSRAIPAENLSGIDVDVQRRVRFVDAGGHETCPGPDEQFGEGQGGCDAVQTAVASFSFSAL